jgi:hypothetical protein
MAKIRKPWIVHHLASDPRTSDRISFALQRVGTQLKYLEAESQRDTPNYVSYRSRTIKRFTRPMEAATYCAEHSAQDGGFWRRRVIDSFPEAIDRDMLEHRLSLKKGIQEILEDPSRSPFSGFNGSFTDNPSYYMEC